MPSPLARFRAHSPLVREAVLVAVALLAGITLLPLAVYLTGRDVLGAYTNGGFLRFWGDFFVGLAHGGRAWWVLALGPYALIMLARGARAAWRQGARV
ncbi:MAG: hypothetical protein NAOJABEB_01325 [Steroidobacteraceae bacterium]|nr:hypothetical protein [Steroidobacteraceae bacterium]